MMSIFTKCYFSTPRPNGYVIKLEIPNHEPSQEITSFCQERLNLASDNSHLKLEDCLGYFEQFYFLLTTDLDSYRLNNQEKENLKQVVLSGLGIACEPGKQQRFEQVLMLYRRDQNWIKCQLSNYRYNLIVRLQDQYNSANRVYHGNWPHTLKLMIQLAEQRQFGLKSESSLHDAYMNDGSINRITQYFETHYPAIISEFEQTVLDNLSHNLMIGLQEFLTFNDIDTSTWDAQGIVIPHTQLDEFNGFFEDKSFDTVIDLLRDETETDDWVLRLKQKSAFQQGVRELITKKLLDDAYAVSVFDVGIVPTFVQELRFKPDVSFEQVCAVNHARVDSAPDCESRYANALLQYPSVMKAYPSFIFNQLKCLLPVLPQLLTTLNFDAFELNNFRAELIQLLLSAHSEGDEDQIALLSSVLSIVIPDVLPETLLENGEFAIKFIQQNDVQLRHPTAFQDVFRLLNAGRVRATTVSDVAQRLTPQEMLGVVRERQKHSLLPLPYCDDLARLEAFAETHRTTETTHWYPAFVREQHPDLIGFEHMVDCFQAVQLMLDALIDCVVSGTMALASAAMIIGIMLTSVIGFVSYLVACAICLDPITDSLLICFINPVLGFLAALTVVIFFEVIMLGSFYLMVTGLKYIIIPIAEYSRENTENFFTALDDFNKTSTSFINQLYATCFAKSEVQPEDALVTRCEKSIDRLLFVLKDDSAHQKGAVLNHIWEQIQQEELSEVSEAVLQRHLATPYEVVYRGELRSLSFFDVAAIKRTRSEAFELDAPNSCFRFFADTVPSTTSERLGEWALSPV